MGHVFVANMTGNVVLLGFALSGATGLSMPLDASRGGVTVHGPVVPDLSSCTRMQPATGPRWPTESDRATRAATSHRLRTNAQKRGPASAGPDYRGFT